MRSLVEEALARTKKEEKIPAPPSDVDEELKKILEGLKTDIKIIGLGGGGSNTISRLVEEGVIGAELYAANTDAQHLLMTRSPKKILLGRRKTKGLGAGARPEIGEESARESDEELRKLLEGTDICMLTCGLGGGTGTGAIVHMAKLAKEAGALTVAFTTLPFKGEGLSRMENAEWGLHRLKTTADTVITIPNDKLVELYPRLPLNQAFKVADELLMRSIKGLTEIITRPGLVNLDFNDLKTIMQGAGVAMIGMGESDAFGEERAIAATDKAIHSPLLDVDISDAKGVLVNVVGGNDMTISEAERVAEELQSRVSKDAKIIWGASVDPNIENVLKVMVVVTGVKSSHIFGTKKSGEKGIEVIQ
ncbi:MAG TPA: cell division protein FtsZ [Euryarchaeota archaeon]|nr:cell division protein FtsZ [Euryarchaeota archaeon]